MKEKENAVGKFLSWYLYQGYGRTIADQIKSDYGTVEAIKQDIESYIWEHDDFYQGCRAWMVATNRLYGIGLKHGVYHYHAFDFEYTSREAGGGGTNILPTVELEDVLPRPLEGSTTPVIAPSSDGACEDCPLVRVAEAFSDEWRLSLQGARLKSEREVFLSWVEKRTPIQHEVLHMYADGFADTEIAEMMQLEYKEVRSITTNLVNWAGRRGFVQDGLTTTG